MGETDEQLPAEKGAVHKLISSSCTSGKKGTGAGRGRANFDFILKIFRLYSHNFDFILETF